MNKEASRKFIRMLRDVTNHPTALPRPPLLGKEGNIAPQLLVNQNGFLKYIDALREEGWLRHRATSLNRQSVGNERVLQ
jgi:hypothetical protein